MTPIIKEITFEVSNPDVPQTILAKQGDADSRFLKARFVCDGEEVSISTNASVAINAFRLSDGMSESFEGVVNDDNTVLVPLHQWMLAFEGVVQSDISVFSGEKKLTSPIFNVKVERAVNVDNFAYFEESIAFYEGESTVFYNPYITKIGYRVFYSEKQMTELNAPNVTRVHSYGVYACSALKKVVLPKVQILDESAFQSAAALTAIDLPSLETAGTNSLRNMPKITSINVPKLKKTGSSCFADNPLLEGITLPSIIELGSGAFSKSSDDTACKSLKKIIISNTNTVCVLKGLLFGGLVSAVASTIPPNFKGIYVPDALVDAYKVATNWTYYADYIKPLSELEVAE